MRSNATREKLDEKWNSPGDVAAGLGQSPRPIQENLAESTRKPKIYILQVLIKITPKLLNNQGYMKGY